MKSVRTSLAVLFAVGAMTMVSCKNAEPTVTETETTTDVEVTPSTTTTTTDTMSVETTTDSTAVKP